MALTMSGATFGRDSVGAKNLSSNIQGQIDGAINALTGANLNSLKSSIANNWAGEDAEAFKARLEVNSKSIENHLKQLKALLQSALDEDARQFGAMQTNNVEVVNNYK
jgi:formiminotetrahydrofolate cyclodeaminase